MARILRVLGAWVFMSFGIYALFFNHSVTGSTWVWAGISLLVGLIAIPIAWKALGKPRPITWRSSGDAPPIGLKTRRIPDHLAGEVGPGPFYGVGFKRSGQRFSRDGLGWVEGEIFHWRHASSSRVETISIPAIVNIEPVSLGLFNLREREERVSRIRLELLGARQWEIEMTVPPMLEGILRPRDTLTR